MKAKTAGSEAAYCQIELDTSGLVVNNYDPIAPIYDDAMGDDFASIVIDPLLEAARPHVPRARRGRYLDLACGSAAVLSRVARDTDMECFGIDRSAQQVYQARCKLEEACVHATLSVGDVVSVQFPMECNLVTMNMDALNHLTDDQDWPILFRKVHSALAENGMFWFDVNTPKRLLDDWNHPEVILKDRLTYVQCPVGQGSVEGVARRRILMRVFTEAAGVVSLWSALIEQIALPTDRVLEMLREAGFAKVGTAPLAPAQKARHIFLKNRDFITATK